MTYSTLTRRTPLRSKPKAWVKPERRLTVANTLPLPRATMATDFAPAATAPKEQTLQHQGYINLVRSMRCIRCGAAPRSQFCHADEGKGQGIKSDCRLGWPGCADCHWLVGTARIYGKAERRALETDYGRRTRESVIACGLWPKRLPLWPADAQAPEAKAA